MDENNREIELKNDKSPGGKEKSRLREITSILMAHDIVRGISPIKLREILEDLGPTYIKLGQILSTRSDILPKPFCDELKRLRSEVEPMEFACVLQVIGDSYGTHWKEIFSEIEDKPLGSASIAQVHRAVLKSGEKVVVKVQRQGIYDTMRRDITLMHKAIRLIPSVRLKETLNINMILDELWVVAQEEMNFLQEASNMEEFAALNRDVKYFQVPKLYRQYTTEKVLVMEYIEGINIVDSEALKADGYDLNEIGTKLVDNFMKQVMEDGYFHADPHPGNVCIKDGKIIWMDMGMMGRLSTRDRELITEAVEGIATGDTSKLQDSVMALGEFRGEPNRSQLYRDLNDFMSSYFDAELGEVDVAEVIQDLMDIMKDNNMTMPHGLTLLGRGLANLEGVLVAISPEISITDIASHRLKSQMMSLENWRKNIKSEGIKMYLSAKNLVEIPTLAAKILREYEKGQTRVNLDIHSSDEFTLLLHHLIRNIVIGLWVMGLLISSSIVCTTDMWPKVFGIPALGAFGYLLAVMIVAYVVLRYLYRKQKNRRRKS